MDSIKLAIETIKAGGIIIVSDDENRENEGDFVMAAEAATSEKIGFINRYSSGIICAPITATKRDALDLPMMVTDNTDPKHTAFTVSIDYRHGTTTGISAADRATTLTAMSDVATQSSDFTRPGHIFPLVAKDRGVLERDGHTEAAVDFSTLAGCDPTGVICEVVNDDGSMSRQPELEVLARAHHLPFVTIADLIKYRLETEQLITQLSESWESNRHGEWRVCTYQDRISQSEISVFSRGNTTNGAPVFVFPSCVDSAHSALRKCNCENAFLAAIRETNNGVGGCIILLPRVGHVRDGELSQADAAIVVQILKDVSVGVNSFECFDITLARRLTQFGVNISNREVVPGLVVQAGNIHVLQTAPSDTYGWRLIGG